ncbi:YegP family protein [Variovorax atrisoli]|uniref:YegP family protein n=1 Tax=Variovorax atrisoli TaxID=3394203 RepID=UPI0003602495|nr:DUF1508 domain-containing protein [Variovorax paradoxus]
MYFEIYSTVGGLLGVQQWRWRLKGANHEIIASGEGYNSKEACLHGISLLQATNTQTPIRQVFA